MSEALKYILLLSLLISKITRGQNEFNFDGQISALANYSPQNENVGLLNGRYIPELNYDWKLDSIRSLYFEGSANMYGSTYFYKGDSVKADGSIQPYRIYARYTTKQLELRFGLQKIDFGSAMILRPLQWFNEIDPRDPLQLTNGVIAGMGRYYLKNSANLWLWVLYGNENPRGFDIIKPNSSLPEIGGRFQYPVPKGELALSYNHRSADASEYFNDSTYSKIPEDRIGLDGKWDLGVGLWFEGAYIKKHQNVGLLTSQTLLTLGIDYTFPLGSGLFCVLEHLVTGYDENKLTLKNGANITALNISYPIGFFDNLSLFTTYSWESEDVSFFLNYQHDFKRITAYFMAYYTPENSFNVDNSENEFVSAFTGPGLRLMLVFNH